MCQLIYLVEVGTLFAVDLDVDEVFVHQRGNCLVLEGLMSHDVAPVAGGVPYRQQHRFVLRLGLGEGLGSPGVPVDRVGRVRLEIGAGLVAESISTFRHHVLSDTKAAMIAFACPPGHPRQGSFGGRLSRWWPCETIRGEGSRTKMGTQ